MPKVKVSVPHQLEPAAALERIKPALEKILRDFQGHDVEQTYTQTGATFRFKSLAFTITGNVVVEPTQAIVEVDLPFAALMFKDKVERAITKNVGRALAPEGSTPATS